MPFLVADPNPTTVDEPPAVIRDLVALNGRLLFVADDATHGEEPWTSDGTAAGTVMVRDIHPTGASAPFNLTVAGPLVYFSADDGTHGVEPWRSDGTAAGTFMLGDLAAGGDSSPGPFVALGGLVLFGVGGGADRGLWRTDGTSGGTVRIADVVPGGSIYGLPNSAVLGDVLLFSGFVSGNGFELWRTDGTSAGTALVKEINPGLGDGSAWPEHLRVLNGRAVFRATDGANGEELWRSDGTEAGTIQLKDIAPGSDDSRPRFFADAPGLLFFSASDAMGSGLWRTDGTREGTLKISNVLLEKGGAAEAFTFPTWANGRLFFAGWDGDHAGSGFELWTSDGTQGGTALLKDIDPTGDSFPTAPVALGDVVYVGANDDTHGNELWRSDGTAAGTVLVGNLNPDGGSYPDELTNVGGTLFFTADDGVNGRALWALTPCGDGVVNPGEECDEGNVADGDCCSARCRAETGPCDDRDACTAGESCGAGRCSGGTPVVCSAACEQCDREAGCIGTPRTGCQHATRPAAALTLTRGAKASKNALQLLWRRGEVATRADFGDPTTTDGYALCLFDAAAGRPRLLLRALAPAGGTCGRRPCWNARGADAFRYRNPQGSPDGLVRIDLRARPRARGSIVVSGHGAALAMPALPASAPITAQVHAGNGRCWEAQWPATAVRRNTAKRLQATGGQ